MRKADDSTGRHGTTPFDENMGDDFGTAALM
jgi:hypothetical protein